MTLSDIRQRVPKTNWRHSRVFEDAEVADEAGLTISQFWQLDELDQAYKIARRRASMTIAAYQSLLDQPKPKDKPNG